MITTKCDKCKNKAFCWSCDEGQISHSFSSYAVILYHLERDTIICIYILMILINN